MLKLTGAAAVSALIWTLVAEAGPAAAQDLELPAGIIEAIEGHWTGRNDSYEVDIADGVVTLRKHGKNNYPSVPLGTELARLNQMGERTARTFNFTASQCLNWQAQAKPYFDRCRSSQAEFAVFKDSYLLSVSGLTLRRERNGLRVQMPPAQSKRPVAPPESSASRKEAATTSEDEQARRDSDWEAKLAEHRRLVDEHQRLVAEREKAIAEQAAKHEANRLAAEAEKARYEQQLAEHRRKVEAAERAEAQYRAALAAQRMPSDSVRGQRERVEFKEGVVLCKPTPSATAFNCKGPLQNVTTRLDGPDKDAALGQACGSSRSIRYLGVVSGYTAYGCGFGIHPTAKDYPGNVDVPAELGVGYVPGRASFYCPKSTLAYCRG